MKLQLGIYLAGEWHVIGTIELGTSFAGYRIELTKHD